MCNGWVAVGCAAQDDVGWHEDPFSIFENVKTFGVLQKFHQSFTQKFVGREAADEVADVVALNAVKEIFHHEIACAKIAPQISHVLHGERCSKISCVLVQVVGEVPQHLRNVTLMSFRKISKARAPVMQVFE